MSEGAGRSGFASGATAATPGSTGLTVAGLILFRDGTAAATCSRTGFFALSVACRC